MNINRWLLPLAVVALLGGCAATGDVKDKKSGLGTKHQVSGSNIENAAGNKKESLAEKPKTTEAAEKTKLYPGTGVFVKPVPTPAADAESGEDVMLNFDGADLREVVKIVLMDILNESYVIDPRVQGVVNIHSSHPIKRSALLPTLEAVLRMNGASLVRELDGVFHVTPFATAAKGALTPQVSETNKPLPPGYSVQIIPLKFISAREMVKILEPFTPDGGIVRVDDARNMLFLGGNARELRHLMETIDIFDVDWIAGMSVGMFTLKSVDVKTAFSELEKIMGDKAQGPLAGVLRIIPIERLNALLVITPQQKYLEQARVWVERLDRSGATDGGVQLYVYHVQNGDAVKMATLLGQAFSKQASQGVTPPTLAPGLKPAEIKSSGQADGGAQPGGTDSVSVSVGAATKIIADKGNNALLILSTPSEYEIIANAIRKLDVVPRQVLIEVMIAEVTLSDEFSFGLEWYFGNYGKGKGGGNGFLDIGAAGISQLSPGFSYAWLDAAGSIKTVLNAMAANSKLNIIASPHIMVSDNHTAKIQVGDRVPTVSQTQALATAIATTGTTGVISSVQYLDTGIMLSVTPHINAGGLVTMEISQEVSNAAKTVSSGIDSPTISKRSAQSTVTVQAGETMVLGGLISEKKSDASSGLPFLSEIPVLGALFGAQNIKGDRTELVMLITPRLVANSQQAREITDEFRKKMSNVALNSEKKENSGARINDKTGEIERAGQ
ncbi:MAG: type II secretion system secretin GspD [Gallionella sp.]|nr:type II secretion system secretin GspD [Gallionella sp.]